MCVVLMPYHKNVVSSVDMFEKFIPFNGLRYKHPRKSNVFMKINVLYGIVFKFHDCAITMFFVFTQLNRKRQRHKK